MKSLEHEFSLTHNTINKYIAEYWVDYKVSNLGELRRYFAFRESNLELLLTALADGMDYSAIEKLFLREFLRLNYSTTEIAHELNIDRRTVNRMFVHHFNRTLFELKNEGIELQTRIREMVIALHQPKTIRESLGISEGTLIYQVKKIFNTLLPPFELRIKLILNGINREFLRILEDDGFENVYHLRVFYIEYLIREGNNLGNILDLLKISRNTLNRILKETFKQTFTVLQKEIMNKRTSFKEYICYQILESHTKNEISDEIKKQMILNLIKEGLNSSDVAIRLGYKNRSSLRRTIHKLWDKNTTFTDLKIALDKIHYNHILSLLNKDINIKAGTISKIVGVSRAKIDSLIRINHSSSLVNSFSSLRIYLRFHNLDMSLLGRLEAEDYTLQDIIEIFVLELTQRGFSVEKISELLHIPKSTIIELST